MPTLRDLEDTLIHATTTARDDARALPAGVIRDGPLRIPCPVYADDDKQPRPQNVPWLNESEVGEFEALAEYLRYVSGPGPRVVGLQPPGGGRPRLWVTNEPLDMVDRKTGVVDFGAKVARLLARIWMVPAGRELVRAIVAGRADVLVAPPTLHWERAGKYKPTTWSYDGPNHDFQRWLQPAPSPPEFVVPGRPRRSLVGIGPATADWTWRYKRNAQYIPVYLILFHELCHAWRAAVGLAYPPYATKTWRADAFDDKPEEEEIVGGTPVPVRPAGALAKERALFTELVFSEQAGLAPRKEYFSGNFPTTMTPPAAGRLRLTREGAWILKAGQWAGSPWTGG
jgi:hypothetical protein